MHLVSSEIVTGPLQDSFFIFLNLTLKAKLFLSHFSSYFYLLSLIFLWYTFLYPHFLYPVVAISYFILFWTIFRHDRPCIGQTCLMYFVFEKSEKLPNDTTY